MIQYFKHTVAQIIVDSKIKQRVNKNIHFTHVFAKSYNFFVIMPEDENDFHHSQQVLNFLEGQRKNITILTHDFRVSLLPPKFRFKVIEYTIEDITRLNLPGKKLIEKLSSLEVNVVVDLNRTENLYCSYLSNIVQSEVRIGFVKKNSDKFYNLQISNNDEQAELSYKNFLNCLQMF
ncbi:MAG: hypothetical protein K8H86_13330 [Ignavibacteriaceae bacterium]|nr:hypothetical protein [Ignavibacteriaceae bacterium]